MNRSEKLLEIAAQETYERIDRDHERAPPRIKPLLAYLRDHLFEPQLDFNQLKRACGIRDNTIPIQFHTALALPPYAYIEDCRLETACRLLRDTDLKIWQITQLLGYSSIQVFSRAFGRWCGLRPTAFRKQERGRPEKPGRRGGPLIKPAVGPSALPGDKPIRVDTLRKGLNGTLNDAEAQAVIRRLLELYPASLAVLRDHFAAVAPEEAFAPDPGGRRLGDEPGGGTIRLVADEAIEDIRLEELWRELEGRPFAAQRELIRHRLRLSGPTLFHDLRRRSREEGRKNRQRGVQVAQLALDSLEAVAAFESDAQRRNLESQGWAWLANSLRLAFDFPGAEGALETAEQLLPEVGADRLVEAEIRLNQAALRWAQSRRDEALALAADGIERSRVAGDPELLAQALILRGVILDTHGDAAAALPDLKEAYGLVDKSENLYLREVSLANLARALILTGRARDATRLLPAARKLARLLDNREVHLFLRWLEAMLSRDDGDVDKARSELVEVRQGFLGMEEMTHAAVASLDLALLELQLGRSKEVMRIVAETLPILEALRASHEATVALGLLQQALEQRKVSKARLDEIRGAVTRIRSGRVAVPA